MTRLWFLAAVAPLLVAAGLLVLHSVLAVVLTYHVGLCLVVPAAMAHREGLGWREHARRLGLVGPGTAAGLRLGAALGAAFAAAPLVAFLLVPAWFPDAGRLRAAMAGWGVDPAAPGLVLGLLGFLNGPAEEVFWRGFLQERLLRGPMSAAALVVAFTAYHVLTVARLAPGPAGLTLMLAGVVATAVFWTWLRRCLGSVWPPVLSHIGATLGYLAICWRLLR